jgi:hypothetical protein
LQEEWTFSTRWIGVARYDVVNGPSVFLRSTTLSLNIRKSHEEGPHDAADDEKRPCGDLGRLTSC